MPTPPPSSASPVHAETVIKILTRRLRSLDPEVRARIEGETDAATLKDWYDEALTIDTEEEARGLADAISRRPPPDPDRTKAPAPAPPTRIPFTAIAAIVALLAAGGGALAYRTHVKREAARFVNTPCGKGTIALIDHLPRPLTVTFFVTPGSPVIDRFTEQMNEMMGDLATRAPGKLAYSVVQVTGDAEQHRAKEAGLQEIALSDEGGMRRGFVGLEFKYGAEREVIPVMSPEAFQAAPFWIVNKLREIRARADNEATRLGVLTGKGEIKLGEASLIAASRPGGPSLKGIIEQAMPFYKLEDVDLHGGTTEIDDSLAGVIVTQPGADYSDEELRRIDRFLMRGGKALLVFAGAVNVKAGDAAMKGELDLHGLDRLLAGYGVEVQKDAVFDTGSPALVRVIASGSAMELKPAAIPLVSHTEGAAPEDQTLDDAFVPFFRIEQLPFPFPSTLVPHPDRQPEARLRVVARSTSRAISVTTGPVDLGPLAAAPTGDPRQRPLAIAVEGRLHSAFPGAAAAVAPSDSRVLVVSSSQFLVNPFARAGNPPPEPALMKMVGGDENLMVMSQPYAQQYLTSTILTFKNALDWASADDATTACSALLAPAKSKD